MTITTAAATARLIADAGIDRVFGLPGGEVLVLIDEFRRAGVDYVLMRHESHAGIAAAVYGKLRRQPGVVLTTLGPGAANLMLPLSSASLDQEPLLAISAQIPDDFPASHMHQRLPLDDAYRPVARYVSKITAANVGEAVPRALAECMRRPFGASYLTLSAREALAAMKPPKQGVGLNQEAAPSVHEGQPREKANDLIDLLATAQRPLVVIGLGTDPANATRIRRWVNEWELPVAVTPKIKGIVDETAENFVGVVSGMAPDGVLCDALKASDLLIGFGLDPVEVDKTWHAELPIQWILEAVNVGGIVPSGTQLVDHAQILDALLAQPPPGKWKTPFLDFQQKRRRMLADRSASSHTMWPGDVVQGAGRGAAARNNRHHRRRLAQIPVRPVLAQSSARNVLDVERLVGHGVRVERGHRRKARAPRSPSAGSHG